MISDKKDCVSTPSYNDKGFTLAETLITLVIVGVVAALTVPTLMNKTNNQEYVSRLNKAYSVLQQSIHKIAMDKGYPQGDYTFVTDTNTFLDDLSKTLNVIKSCRDDNSCITHSYTLMNNTENSLTGSENAFVTADGISYTYAQGYRPDIWGISEEDNSKFLGRFWVDVNGKSKPQKAGKDLFAFVVINGKGILPAGYGNNSSDCNKNNMGLTCAAKVLKENAINY